MTIDEIMERSREADWDSPKKEKRDRLGQIMYQGGPIQVTIEMQVGEKTASFSVRVTSVIMNTTSLWAPDYPGSKTLLDIDLDLINSLTINGTQIQTTPEVKTDIDPTKMEAIMNWMMDLVDLNPKDLRVELAAKFRDRLLKFGTTLGTVKIPCNRTSELIAMDSAAELMKIIDKYLPPIIKV